MSFSFAEVAQSIKGIRLKLNCPANELLQVEYDAGLHPNLLAYPLIEAGLSRKDCLSWMAENGFPLPPKSTCIFCPYHNNGLWAEMKQNQPDEFARAVAFEQELNQMTALQGIKGREFLHSKRVPLSEVDFGAAVSEDANHFINECEGLCGI